MAGSKELGPGTGHPSYFLELLSPPQVSHPSPCSGPAGSCALACGRAAEPSSHLFELLQAPGPYLLVRELCLGGWFRDPPMSCPRTPGIPPPPPPNHTN